MTANTETRNDKLRAAHEKLQDAVAEIVSGDGWKRMHQKPPSVDSLRSLHLGRRDKTLEPWSGRLDGGRTLFMEETSPLPPDMQLAAEPGFWQINLAGGPTIHLMSHGYSVQGDEYVFTLLMEGQPCYEVAVARIPTELVRSVVGG